MPAMTDSDSSNSEEYWPDARTFPWSPFDAYNEGEDVYIGKKFFICKASHVETHPLAPNTLLWAKAREDHTVVRWSPYDGYSAGTKVKIGKRAFVCIKEHLGTHPMIDDPRGFWEPSDGGPQNWVCG